MISINEVVARKLLIEHIYPLVPVKADDKRTVHLAIAGFGRLGKTLATRAIRMLVLPNNSKLKVTVIDRGAEAEAGNLLCEHPYLKEYCDLNICSGDIEHAAFRDEIAELLYSSKEKNEVPILVFCVDDAYINTSAALFIAESLWKKSGALLPIYVRMTETSGWGDLLKTQENNNNWMRQITGFGSIPDICNKEILTQEKLDRLAKGVHDYFNSKFGKLGDPSSKEWDELPWEFRDSSRQAADHMHIKLRSLGLKTVEDDGSGQVPWPPEDPILEKLSKQEHRRWVTERTLSGWRYGKETDRVKRISKDLIPWDSLDDEAKEKDRNHIRVYADILRQANLKIVKDT